MGFITSKFQDFKRRQKAKSLLRSAADIARRASALEAIDDASFKALASDLSMNDAPEHTRLAFAAEAARRALGLKPYEVQLAGATVLSRRSIAEMQTGEGKTLTAALAAAARALAGHKVHVATVNDYLAGRDAAKLVPFFEAIGLTVGHASATSSKEDKRAAYQADVVYATAQELAFDYLRDNLVGSRADKVQGPLDTLLVDEADSILLDEASTPLILSGIPRTDSGVYTRLTKLSALLTEGEHFVVDRKVMLVDITDEGFDVIEQWLRTEEMLSPSESLHSNQNLGLAHSVSSSIAAHALYRRDMEYMVKGDEIVIVDEHTGRAMNGRRWSDGIHQAIEAKEGLIVRSEAPTLASITYQSFVRLYGQLSGLTGTAQSEEDELRSLYGLDVEVIPTHKPIQRIDDNDRVFRSNASRDAAVIQEVISAGERQQPVLIGTDSVETSETLAETLLKHGIRAAVLNARNHEQEATIIAEAGRPGAVTIATQMAGRGTDILLGGNLQARLESVSDDAMRLAVQDGWENDLQTVIEAGGLYVIGTSRSPSRRVDRQLRGRSGRQGDPGRSCFFLSIDDGFVRAFAGDKLDGIMDRLAVESDEALEGRMMDRIIKQAQSSRESIDREMRQELMRYDSVLADQRAAVYTIRNEWLDGMEGEHAEANRATLISRALAAGVEDMRDRHQPRPDGLWDSSALVRDIARRWNLSLPDDFFSSRNLTAETLPDVLSNLATSYYAHRRGVIDPRLVNRFEQVSLLEGLDRAWQEHQKRMAMLRDGINLRSYANENPRYAFQIQGGKLFESVFDEAYQISAQILLGVRLPAAQKQAA